MSKVVLLSGPIGAGKSTLTASLAARVTARNLSTSSLLKAQFPDASDRAALQALGAKLDRETDEAWVADAVGATMSDAASILTVVDCVRTGKQAEHFRARFGSRLIHVHLTANEAVRKARYVGRVGERTESISFEAASADPIEQGVHKLAAQADLVLDTTSTAEEVVTTLVLGLASSKAASPQKLVDVIVGGQYGSEGKAIFAPTWLPSTIF